MRFLPIKDWSPGYLYVCPRHVDIRVRCETCGIEKDFDRDTLPIALYRAEVEDIERRLKCACGEKKARLLFGHLEAAATDEKG
ncbi:hypothetical protein [Rhizobium sp. BK602]|uniref:hypothetical protein n=1 Tax=Rhizobium sp. BK602 TaxID=2586986 RepID=UPI00182CAC22|nr:hypothetical protein [Rhizobium sp. BK602]MBB3608694.1 hypothetical protein [Rhizobium sp. BK602]